jgi:hypothetical protein
LAYDDFEQYCLRSSRIFALLAWHWIVERARYPNSLFKFVCSWSYAGLICIMGEKTSIELRYGCIRWIMALFAFVLWFHLHYFEINLQRILLCDLINEAI